MARVIYSAQINELIGSVGGTTFQRNASGTICRLKKERQKSTTLLQQNSSVLFSQALVAWRGLTSVQREAWNVAAALDSFRNLYGAVKSWSGLNYFTSGYVLNTLASRSFPVVPLGGSFVIAAPSFEFNVSEHYLEFDDISGSIGAGFDWFIYASPLIRGRSVFNRPVLRLMKVLKDWDGSLYDFVDDWESHYGMSLPASPVFDSWSILCAAYISMPAHPAHSVFGFRLTPNE